MNKYTEKKNRGSIKRLNINRILVTGGCGFIGSHLIDKLMQDEVNEVICLDNCFSGNKQNIIQWIHNPRFEFIRHDVTIPISLEVDEIYHLACPASPVFYQHNGVKTIQTCVLGTINMLELAKQCNAKILLASTSEVYGDPEKHPQTEEYWGNVNPIGIRSCYDESKRLAETLAFQYYRQYNTSIRVARIFNTYGPRMLKNDGRVISNFVTQVLSGKPLTIYGDGNQTRSFCYISDMVRGLILFMRSKYIGPINLGNPQEYTIKNLVRILRSIVISPVSVSFSDLPSDDPKRRCPDISKAKEYLHWEPVIDLQKGLNIIITES